MIFSFIYNQKYLSNRIACFHYNLTYIQYLNFNCFIQNAEKQNFGGHDTVEDPMRPLANYISRAGSTFQNLIRNLIRNQMSFDETLWSLCNDLKLSFTLKSEQISAMHHIFNKRHTFCVLPTGFGKSLIFAYAWLVLLSVTV